jgi:hypothetical protein
MKTLPAGKSTWAIPGGPPSYIAVAAALAEKGLAVNSKPLVQALLYNAKVIAARQTRYEKVKNSFVERAVKELAQTDSWKNEDGISWRALAKRLGVSRARGRPMEWLQETPDVREALDAAARRLPMHYSGKAPGLLKIRREMISAKAIEELKSRVWLQGAKPSYEAVSEHLGLTVRALQQVSSKSGELRHAFQAAFSEWENESSVSVAQVKESNLETLPKAVPSERQQEGTLKGTEGNFAKFIEEAKRSLALRGVVWDSWRWNPVDWDSSRKTERAHVARSGIIFSNRETSNKRSSKYRERAPMMEPYLSFAKADLLIFQQARDTGSGALKLRLLAHRFVEQVFRQRKRQCVGDLTLSDFYEAEREMKKMSPATAYMMVCNLAQIGAVLDGRGLNLRKVAYQNSMKEPLRFDSWTPEGQAAGEKKMMSDPAVEAFAKLSTNPPENDLSLLVIRITDLLIVGGFRIGEVLSLPVDTLARDKREIIINPATGEKAKAMGLKYVPEKVNDYRTKPISPSAVPIVERAINDINRICGPAREEARWMEENPGRLRSLASLNTDEMIGGSEVCRMLGIRDDAYAKFGGVPREKRYAQNENRHDTRKPKLFFRVGDVERYFLKMRDTRAVVKGADGRAQRLSETLVVVPRNGEPWRATPMNHVIYHKRIQKLLPGFRSHQARHRLNTLSEFGGMTDIEQMKLFGRRTASQNHTYKHGTVARRKDQLVKAVLGGEVHGSVARIAQNLPVEDREAFIRAVIGYVHVTPFGICIHDFAALPCQEDHQCLHCGDYTRVKGDEESRKNILEARRGALAALEVASRALVEQSWAKEFAEKHIAAAQKKIEGCDAALAIDDLPIESPDPMKVFPHAPSLFKALK